MGMILEVGGGGVGSETNLVLKFAYRCAKEAEWPYTDNKCAIFQPFFFC